MPQISVVSPTYCEVDNVPVLVEQLGAALRGLDWELVIVDDDSPDGTSDLVRQIAQANPRVRVVHRLDRRGLAGAIIEGMMATSSPIVAVIDADLQHDPTVLPRMVGMFAEQSDLDVVIASRYASGGDSNGGFSSRRRNLSLFGTRLARTVSRTSVRDPLSGFFAIRRDVLMTVVRSLSRDGFKILLDILSTSRTRLAVAEIPYAFAPRARGSSKLTSAVALQYATLLTEKALARIVPVRLVKFALVGASGVLVHMGVLHATTNFAGFTFTEGQTAGAIAAMTTNFFLNNQFTFSDRKLKGMRFIAGLFSFYAICSLGALGNVGVAAFLFDQNHNWWLSGLAGIAVGTVWNYAVSSRLAWGVRT